MPRPGPRPYECVRRAWHSDRHQPIRGSLIQEIFRLANEVHSPATRKNKEWQEKLPFVVLKAEEIMYSKANSEAEYMDMKTLWDRANDAIDTIIRRDDASESEDLLQPCIEAALHLGCIPRRASRSQRHSNPVCYLNPNMKEATEISRKPQNNNTTNLGLPIRMLPSSTINVSETQFGLKYSSLGPEVQFMASDASKDQNESYSNAEPEFCMWPILGRAYPLYYGDAQSKLTQIISQLTRQEQGATNTPFVTKHPVQMGTELPSCTEYDLSLRLGLPSPPSSEVDSVWTRDVEDVGSSSSGDGVSSCMPLPQGMNDEMQNP
ncbi:hypothetical protein AXF42_Ash010744 [Apostasia shenzhenica]|uniref:Histone acetyltransferase n=1 Tax=Apostasia shenzhenica TaxID=1088818 RepID=A0A2I0A0I1_9ASPA|nr:hypothetical protein AXF42_Ash010744 [Apostasia shenzhenica]